MRKVCKAFLYIVFALMCFSVSVNVMAASTKTSQSTSKAAVKKQTTSRSYKKYVGKWETVGYTLNVRVINKNYLKAYITARNGDRITIDRKMNLSRKQKFWVTSKKGVSVQVTMKLQYGKPYRDYGGNIIRNGPTIHLAGSNAVWSEYNYYKVNKNGKTEPVMLVYTRTVK